MASVRFQTFPQARMRGTQFAGHSAFAAVAEEASFTKAAKRLGLSTRHTEPDRAVSQGTARYPTLNRMPSKRCSDRGRGTHAHPIAPLA
jgi:hypothetical protein